MERFLETAGLASVGGWFRRRGKTVHIEPGQPCANCGAPMQGPWCHNCGQSADDLHRSVFKLIGESIEGFFHADGRLWQTLPRLLFKPGRLTRDYLDGKRAPQIPPFRMFLVLLLIVFFAGHLATAGKGGESVVFDQKPATPAQREAARQALGEVRADLARDMGPRAAEVFDERTAKIQERLAEPQPKLPQPPAPGEPPKPGAQVLSENTATLKQLDLSPASINLDGDAKTESAAEHWLRTRIKAIRDNPERFALILEIWAHRVAILALPVSALLLTLLFVFNRRFYVFDHLLFSMHSLSFQLILLTTIFLLSMLVGPGAWWLILLAPIHLYKHMRGTYATSRFGTVLRMGFLWIGTLIGFSLLAVLWVVLGANAMAGH